MTRTFATYNVNGIRARKQAVIEWLAARDPDVVCLQEIKCRNEDFPVEDFERVGYRSLVRGQKAYNGVALLSRNEAEPLAFGFTDDEQEDARLLAARVDGVLVVNTYVPQGRSVDNPAFEQKLAFFSKLRDWFDRHADPHQPVLWCGDINVARYESDLYDPERYRGEVGFHPSEHEALTMAMAFGFEDLYRKLHPDGRQYTFWDYRLPNGVKRNLGWRIDLMLATSSLAEKCGECAVDIEPRLQPKPSDHTPLWAEFDFQG